MFDQAENRSIQERGFAMKKYFLLITIVLLLAACAPSVTTIQTAISETQAVWTPIPTYTPQPTYTPKPTIVITQVVVQTPRPRNQTECRPLTNMDYSDNSKVAILLQAYVSQLPGVKSVSYTIPERLFGHTLSQIYFVT